MKKAIPLIFFIGKSLANFTYSQNRIDFAIFKKERSLNNTYLLGIVPLLHLYMQKVTTYKIAKTLSCHSWNGDKTREKWCQSIYIVEIAVASRNSKDIVIYGNCNSPQFEDWKLLHTLSGVKN